MTSHLAEGLIYHTGCFMYCNTIFFQILCIMIHIFLCFYVLYYDAIKSVDNVVTPFTQILRISGALKRMARL